MDRLIYVVGDFTGQYGEFWGHLGKVTCEREMFLAMPEEFDLVCFTGGVRVTIPASTSPFVFRLNQPKESHTHQGWGVRPLNPGAG